VSDHSEAVIILNAIPMAPRSLAGFIAACEDEVDLVFEGQGALEIVIATEATTLVSLVKAIARRQAAA
jgi:hypothetical protein